MWLRVLLDLIFPPKCFGCGTPVKSGVLFCGHCETSPLELDALCSGCAKPKHQCICAQIAPRYFTEATAVFAYTGAVRQGIHTFKYQDAAVYGEPLGVLLGRRCGEKWDEVVPFDGVTYVPATKRKAAARGYVPAKLLAEAAARELHLPLIEGCLEHTGNRISQMSRGNFHERKDNAAKSFVCPEHPTDIRGMTLLLVDDIFTTGNTLNVCAKLLCAQGAVVYGGTLCTAISKKKQICNT